MLKSFYPKFPFIHPKDFLLDPYPNRSFNDVIASKKEFAELRLEAREEFPEKPGDYLNHQKYIARFLSATTGYDELLLFHEPGTGKTCSAVATIENLRADKLSMMKGAVICAKGDGLLKNFVQELVFTCTDGRYIPENYDELSSLQKTHRLRKITSEFYSFHTFEIFAKTLQDMTDAQILNDFEDHIFVIDEVHNLRQHDTDEDDDPDKAPEAEEQKLAKPPQSLNIYFQFERLFRVLTRRKILLMSGTPVKDAPEEFASVMNLILPQEWKFKTGKDFVKTYFDSNGTLKDSAKPDMKERIRGRISYLNSATSQVEKRFVGKPVGDLKHFRVAVDRMSEFQSRSYAKAYASDAKDKSIFIGSRQASLFVFPDGSFGKAGFDKFIIKKTKKSLREKSLKIHYEASRDLLAATDSLEKIAELSSKFAAVLKVIASSGKSKHFVYCQYVNGSGAIVFGKMLERLGYVQATGSETTKGKRYVLISRQTASTTAIQKLINAFNYDKNVDGEYISVLIGSRVMNEGFTLKNVRNEFILTSHWNYAEIAQAIARGWRVGSHNELLERGDANVSVSVYQCVSLPVSSSVPSIDLEMYRVAEEKDVINRQIERVVKETAFDCPLTLARNRVLGYDGQRECDYTACDYECDGTTSYPLDTSTSDLLKTDLPIYISRFLSFSFRNSDFVSLRDLKAAFPHSDDFEISMAMKRLIESSATVSDRLGFEKFIRFRNDEIFLSADPQSKDPTLSRFYSVNLVLSAEKSFEEILNERYEESLPAKIEELFAYPEKTRELIVKLSKEIQREILQFCLVARARGSNKNASIRDDILSFYYGFYDERPIDGRKTQVVSLYADSLGHSCFDAAKQKFVACSVEQLPQKRAKLKDVEKIGYFGLFNPTLKDFCLRLVTEAEKSETDLRKLAVGRRCVNFESGILIDIIARRMLLDAPDDFLKNESYSQLAERLRKSKYATEKDFVDSETVKRILFWTTRTKDQICDEMKRWFEERDLLETNFNCGSQAKKRLKAH